MKSAFRSPVNILPNSEISRMGASKLAVMYSKENPLFSVMKGMAEVAVDGRAAILHGAIRFPDHKHEYRDASIVMKAWGLEMQNVYDLPGLHVAGSAACPVAPGNESFRMFMSMFRQKEAFKNNPDLLGWVEAQLAKRPGIDGELLELSRKAISDKGLPEADAHRQTDLVAAWLQIDSSKPLPAALYNKLLAAGSDVAADIVCFPKTHLNHLTPQIAVDPQLRPVGKNIFELTSDVQKLFALVNKDAIEGGKGIAAEEYLRQYLGDSKFEGIGVTGADFIKWAKLRHQVETAAAKERGEDVEKMPFQGLTMIGMQGPRKPIMDPATGLPESQCAQAAYLWQVSNKGVPLELDFERPDGSLYKGMHMAPFIEFEQRGLYLTKKTAQLIEEGADVDKLLSKDLQKIERQGLAYFTYQLADGWQENEFIKTQKRIGDKVNGGLEIKLEDLIDNGAVEITPIKYPGFLGKSAQGIFAGNLTRGGEASPNDNATTKISAGQALHKELGYEPVQTDELVKKQVDASKKLLSEKLKLYGIVIKGYLNAEKTSPYLF